MATLLCVVPSQAVVGEPVTIFVRGQDIWGNPTPAPENVALAWLGDTDSLIEGTALLCREPGVGWVEASAETAQGTLTSRSDFFVAWYANQLSQQHYWDELHAQSAVTIGTGSEAEYFTFGRDVARLDFMSIRATTFRLTTVIGNTSTRW